MTIQSAAQKLQEKGYELGKATTDLKKGITSYQVKKNGQVVELTTKEIIKLVK